MTRKSIVDQKSERDVDNTDDNLKEVSDSESEQSSSGNSILFLLTTSLNENAKYTFC